MMRYRVIFAALALILWPAAGVNQDLATGGLADD